MSHEFYQVMVGDPAMSLYSWKQLARWSLEYSCLSDHEKEQALEDFGKIWKEFCEQVVKKYGKWAEGAKTREDNV